MENFVPSSPPIAAPIIDLFFSLFYHSPPRTSQVRMRVDCSSKGPMFPLTLIPRSSRITEDTGGTRKRQKESFRNHNHSEQEIVFTYDVEVDLPVPGGRPLEVHPALVRARVLLRDPQQRQHGRRLRLGVQLGAVAVVLVVAFPANV